MISKSYDCFAPVSKFIPKTEVPDCHNLDLWMTVNGKMIQKGNTKMMIHTVGQRKKTKTHQILHALLPLAQVRLMGSLRLIAGTEAHRVHLVHYDS